MCQRLPSDGHVSALTVSKLAVQIKLRNAADHGEFDDVSSADATTMVAYVEEFLEREL